MEYKQEQINNNNKVFVSSLLGNPLRITTAEAYVWRQMRFIRTLPFAPLCNLTAENG